MSKLFSPLAIAGGLLSLPFLAAPALALSSVTFVSGKGTDTGACASPGTPCRTFQFAFGQTSPRGEINVLDPADYGGLTITNSITITGVEGAGIFRPAANNKAITINAGANDTINLSRLTLDGLADADTGIELISGGSLTVSHCVVRNFTDVGIALIPTGATNATKFLIRDTLASDNHDTGIAVQPRDGGRAQGTLDHVSMNNNGNDGMGLDAGINAAGATILAVDSIATNNTSNGFAVRSGAVLRLAHSAATGNGTGVRALGARARSAGNNFIDGNGTNVVGTLTRVGTR